MDPVDRMQRAVAMRAIASKTEDLENAGADPVTIKTFSSGALRELANQIPDTDKYKSAFMAASNFKNQNSKISNPDSNF
jgi:hypothetical protein